MFPGNIFRRWLLIFAPLPILSASWGVTHWTRGGQASSPEGNHVVAAPIERRVTRRVAYQADTDAAQAKLLAAACAERGEDMKRQLGDDCSVIVRPPFVVAGDATTETLDVWYKQTIAPAAQGMAKSYFKIAPDEPITILLFANETSYNHYAKRLFGDEGISIYGYYRRHLRTLVMNISTGGGTLVHELTHALMGFDFPEVPDWFNEGLASLHEQCRFRDDGSGIDGLLNWRLPQLQQSIQNGKVLPLRELARRRDFRTRDVPLNYAMARYLCLFLQERKLLERYYREFRANIKTDPTGEKTLLALFPDYSWSKLDGEYRAWALKLRREE